ncbi:hypothetical protein ACIQUQ_14770 [Streptomyces sp. NPDC101118]|uniref:hypothetical protein n=1 Tax=Streptomyces sp. NPDC101118 TaxID=3366109 RepID=UPI003806B4A5
MRKALTVPAIALAASLALAAPVAAYAAGPTAGTGGSTPAPATPTTATATATAAGTGTATPKVTPTATTPATPTPAPATSTVSLSKDSGAPGEKIAVTVRTTVKDADAHVSSKAFGGRVPVKDDGHGVWTGTAVVAKDVKLGYYGVDAFAGGKKFDTVKFTATEGRHGGDSKPVTPLKPAQHKKPKGGVNTGLAPAGVTADDD